MKSFNLFQLSAVEKKKRTNPDYIRADLRCIPGASKYLKSMCAVAAAGRSSLAMSKLAWKWENTTKTGGATRGARRRRRAPAALARAADAISQSYETLYRPRLRPSWSVSIGNCPRVPYPTGPAALLRRRHSTFSRRAPNRSFLLRIRGHLAGYLRASRVGKCSTRQTETGWRPAGGK